VLWSPGGGVATDETQDDDVTASAETSLPGVESVPGYLPISNSETAEATEAEESDYEELRRLPVDADYAEEPEFFGKLVKLLPRIAKGVGKVISNPVVSRAVKLFLASRGIRLESGEADAAGEPSLLEVVIGADDRVRINNTAVRPWSGICHLNITARNGQRFIGTGWLIAPRTVITAGHCVYIHNAGGWVSEVEVSAGRNAAVRPFGAIKSSRVSSSPEWVAARNRNHDYGCIILPKAPRSTSGALPFSFNYAARTDVQIRSRALNLSGYPGDKGGITQWFHARMAKAVTPDVITYDIDTAGGQSGSPVWHLENNVRTAVGIHTNGSPLGNSATRIRGPVLTRLNIWKAAGA
jgi:glutamyl endopeptidase